MNRNRAHHITAVRITGRESVAAAVKAARKAERRAHSIALSVASSAVLDGGLTHYEACAAYHVDPFALADRLRHIEQGAKR